MLLSPSPMNDRIQDPEQQTMQSLSREPVCISTVDKVSQLLRRTDQWAFRDTEVLVQDGALLIKGQITNYHQKQLAQEAVRKIHPHKHIRNELNVINLKQSERDSGGLCY